MKPLHTEANTPESQASAPAPCSASAGIVGLFLAEYAALVRRTGIYVDRDEGLAMPIQSTSKEMETIEEHIARLYREERLPLPNTQVSHTAGK